MKAEQTKNVHEIKCWPDGFYAVENGTKRAEFRRNDRDYRTGDLVLLREYVPTHEEWIENGGTDDDWVMGYWNDVKLKPGVEDTGDNKDEDFDVTLNMELPSYTGDTMLLLVTHVQTGFGIPDGYCMLSVERVRLS